MVILSSKLAHILPPPLGRLDRVDQIGRQRAGLVDRRGQVGGLAVEEIAEAAGRE
jgi:hypothetical protein